MTTLNKKFWFKKSGNYTLSDSSLCEISNSIFQLKDTGKYYSDTVTKILLHLDETDTSTTTITNSAGKLAPEDHTGDAGTWGHLLNPECPAGTYKFRYEDTTKEVAFGLGDCNSNSFLMTFSSSNVIDTTESLGSGVGTPRGNATSGNANGSYFDCQLDINHIGGVSYKVADNFDFMHKGTIRFTFKPNFTGTHGTGEMSLWSMPGTTNSIYVTLQADKKIKIYLYNTEAVELTLTGTYLFDPTSGTDYRFQFDFDFTTGFVKIYIQDVLRDTLTITAAHRTRTLTGLDNFYLGHCANVGGYAKGMFSYIGCHKEYLLAENFFSPSSDPVYSPSGIPQIVTKNGYYYLGYNSNTTKGAILKVTDYTKMNHAPQARHIISEVVTYVSSVTDCSRSGCLLNQTGLFNSKCFYLNGTTDYAKILYNANLSISTNTYFTIDFSTKYQEYGDTTLFYGILGNLDIANSAGMYVAINASQTELRLYKHALNQYCYFNLTGTKYREFNRYSISFDASGSDVVGYINGSAITSTYPYHDSIFLGKTSQPSNITGVIIKSNSTNLASGLLEFNHTAQTLVWNGGSPVNMPTSGNYTLTSVNGDLYVTIDITKLPIIDKTDTIAIEAYFKLDTFTNSTQPYYVGSFNGIGEFYKGYLEEVRLSAAVRDTDTVLNTIYTEDLQYCDVVKPYTPASLLNWISFNATLLAGNQGIVTFQFSNNSGTSFIYYDTVTAEWKTTGGDLTKANTLAQLTATAIAKWELPTYSGIAIRIILNSTNYTKYVGIYSYDFTYNAIPEIDRFVAPTNELTIKNTYQAFNSRYKYAPIFDYDSEVILDGRQIPIISQDLTDSVYIIPSYESGRPDLISLRFYGSSKYWNIIADNNDIFDPIAEMVTGVTIRVPALSRALQFI